MAANLVTLPVRVDRAARAQENVLRMFDQELDFDAPYNLADFSRGHYAADDLTFEITASGFRCDKTYVYLTAAEYQIISAISKSGKSGYRLYELPILLGKKTEDRSINIVRTHVSNIRKKLNFICQGRIYLAFSLTSMKYYIVDTGNIAPPQGD